MLPQNIFIRQLFHILFVNIYQHLLIWSFTFPMYLFYIDQQSMHEINVGDILFTFLWCICFGIEVVANSQMFKYQTAKYKWYAFKKDISNKSILKDQSKLYAIFEYADIEQYEIGFYLLFVYIILP